jgi:hypothetical protein
VGMIAGQLRALEKLEAAGGLGDEDRAAIQAAKRRWRAHSQLETGKRQLQAGEYGPALAALRESHALAPSAKLGAIVALLRVAPPVARWLFLRAGAQA